MDFNKYKFRMNIKSILFYEKFSGKSFFQIATEEDVDKLKYSILVKSNDDLLMTYDVYKIFSSDKKVKRWIDESYEKAAAFISQINFSESISKEGSGDNDEEDDEPMTISRLVSSLIIRYGVSAEYVMNEMELYEITDLFSAAESKVKDELTDKRFWTYLQVLPQIDGKKIKSPDKLVPFAWEKADKKKKAEKELQVKARAKVIGMELDI